MVNFGIFREIALPFETVLKKIPAELRRNSFEIVSNVRIDNELQKHIGIKFKKYAIISVCNMALTYKALMRDDAYGLVLACNLIIYEKNEGSVVGTIRPSQFTTFMKNDLLLDGALTLERKLGDVLDSLSKRRFSKTKSTDSQEKAVA